MLSNKTKVTIVQQQTGLLNLFNRQEVTIVTTESKRNEAAFVIGVLGGLFGILGIAHIFNHNVPRGLALLIFGTVAYWIFIVALATILSTISEALVFVAIAIHLYIIWNHANSGASINPHPTQEKKK